MKPIAKISDAEWDVMTVLWNRSPLPASDVVEQLQSKRHWRLRTVRTLLDRLVKKRVLSAAMEGKRYLYRPLVDMEDCVRMESQSFLDRVFGGEPAPMLIHLVRNSKLSPSEIAELRRLLSEKEK
ncbi:MAG: BlaI/MecI/CopY family transcriptional regulator [Verrucomicrobiia bacterium]